ncbi:MAG: T9SS type A sorting domain-containing protein, partial [Candidatus Kapaibacterium sp.]
SLSPNPTTGIITVHNAPANILHVTVSSILGESIIELTHPNAPEFTLDLSKLPPGTYIARFSMANEVITRKILKE